eukprot:Opistho-2@1578
MSARRAIQVGNYVISTMTLGEGVHKVKLASHVLTGEKVAVKIVDKKKIKAESDRVAIMREIDALKRLNHENIIRLYEVYETSDEIYMFMEHAEGGDMYEYMKRKGPLTEFEAKKLTVQIVRALHCCHSSNIVHRDLKPDNVLIDITDTIKLSDFGLCNPDHRKSMSTFCGSHYFAAPEMLLGDQYSGPTADIWSLGVMLHNFLTGQLPFEGQLSVALSQIVSGDYTIPDTVSKSAQDLIHRILTVETTARATLDDVRKHPWFLEDPAYPCTIDPSCSDDSGGVDAALLQSMRAMNFEDTQVRDAIVGNQHNNVSATYHLLARRDRRKSLGVDRPSTPLLSPAGTTGEAVYSSSSPAAVSQPVPLPASRTTADASQASPSGSSLGIGMPSSLNVGTNPIPHSVSPLSF